MTLKRSFPPVVDADVRLLVLGSLPGEKSLAAQRYYANPHNHFWKLMSAVIERDLEAIDYPDRLATLLAHHVGLWDVVASATRKGSTDATIRDLTANDLAALAARLPKLRAIGFNGGTSFKHGLKQLGTSAERYALVQLPSSSPLHTVGLAAKLPGWLELKAYL